jgi:hypothetical protein
MKTIDLSWFQPLVLALTFVMIRKTLSIHKRNAAVIRQRATVGVFRGIGGEKARISPGEKS